jgi:hypothetical protein
MVALKKDRILPSDSSRFYFQLREPVVVFYGTDRVPVARSFSSSNSLMRLLSRLGRRQIPVWHIIKGGEVLAPRSVRSLNLFLKHGRGLRYLRPSFGTIVTKWAWRDLEAALTMKWRQLTPSE